MPKKLIVLCTLSVVLSVAGCGGNGIETIPVGTWTATEFSGSGGDTSIYALTGSRRAGSSGSSAALWTGLPGTTIDLNPAGTQSGIVKGINDTNQVGTGYPLGSGDPHAYFWSGSSATAIDLTPTGAILASADCLDSTHQYGQVRLVSPPNSRAARWSGTASSFVDMNPTGAISSVIAASDGVQQVGTATDSNGSQAGLWKGTASSFASLKPAGSISSLGTGVSGGVQVGFYSSAPGQYRACRWNGTAGSFVDLHPVGATDSRTYAISGKWIVGAAIIGGQQKAGFWYGQKTEFVDLSSYLPAGVQGSKADSVWADSTTTYVGVSAQYGTPSNRCFLLKFTRTAG